MGKIAFRDLGVIDQDETISFSEVDVNIATTFASVSPKVEVFCITVNSGE